MVEELKDASDIKKLIGKNKGEEDPLLVAQRFLNIFRQLHIFDQKRREEFNSLILAQKPEIRGSFGLLPGGSVLQEYVDELEISKGITQSNGNFSIAPSLATQDKESPLAKIKNAQQQSSSPTQVSIAGDAKLVADASFAQVLSQSVSNALMAVNASKTGDVDKLIEAIKENASQAKFAPDDKFATTMARAFSQALQYSDAGKKADIKELIEAVRESRKIEFPEGFSTSGGSPVVAPLIADEASFAQSIAMAVAKVVNDSKNNSDLSAEIKDLASAVRESRKLELPDGFMAGGNITPATVSTPLISDETAFAKTIAEAMAKVVNTGTNVATGVPDLKELVEAIRENSTNNAEAISKAMVDGLSPLLTSLEKNNINQAIPAKISIDTDNNFSDVIAKAFTQTFEISEKRHQEQTERLIAGFQNIMNKERNSNSFENKNNKNKANNQQQISMLGSEQLEKITQEFTQTLQSINDSRKSENREISLAIKETSKELIKLFAKHNTNKENSYQAQDNMMIHDIVAKVAQAQSSIFQEMAKQQTNELSNIISMALKESQKSSIDTIVDAVKKLQANRSIFSFSTQEVASTTIDDNSIADNNVEPISTKDEVSEKKGIRETIKEKKSSVAKYIKSAFEKSPIENNSPASSSDWGFSENQEDPIEELSSITTDETENNQEIEVSANAEEQNWEWEYEESNEISGEEGEDWEWEYEETAEASGEENEDWEWEYEEPDTVEPQGLEGEDWEWEYEEDTENADNADLLLAESEENLSFNTDNEIDNNIIIPSLDDDTNLLAPDEAILLEESTPIDKGEIVIAELRNKQNITDPYLLDNISV